MGDRVTVTSPRPSHLTMRRKPLGEAATEQVAAGAQPRSLYEDKEGQWHERICELRDDGPRPSPG